MENLTAEQMIEKINKKAMGVVNNYKNIDKKIDGIISTLEDGIEFNNKIRRSNYERR